MPSLRIRAVAIVSFALVTSGARAGGAETMTTVTRIGGVEVVTGGVEVVRPVRAVHALRATARRQAGTAAAAGAEIAPIAAMRVPVNTTPTLPGAQRLLQTALSFVGTPYSWGGASPSGFDCSGFTSYVFARSGIAIPRTADVQFAAGRPVLGDPLPGDLVFFQTYDWGASHVGIYLGDGRFVNSIGADVHVATFASSYFRSRYLGARRFLPDA